MVEKSMIDKNIIEEGLKLAGVKTEIELIELAIKEFIARRKRKMILELEGNIKWEENLDELRRNRF